MSQGPPELGERSERDTEEAPTQQLGLAASSDHCANCATPLASDQRYCVNCGERRGKPRFTLAEPSTATVETAAVPPRPPRRPSMSSGFTLIAGIATLLLAMGVGVLIGHNSAGSSQRVASSAPVKISVNGAGSAGSGGGSATSAKRSDSGASKGKAHSASKSNSGGASTVAPAPKPPPAVAKKASAAASKVLGGATNVAPVTVTQGGSCSAGQSGCSGNKFSGNFFGGG